MPAITSNNQGGDCHSNLPRILQVQDCASHYSRYPPTSCPQCICTMLQPHLHITQQYVLQDTLVVVLQAILGWQWPGELLKPQAQALCVR
jgi:hypothetical protein